ncbi:MAG TPA: DUF6655 family protein [Verrucomicrobiae bacterium]|jgi:hypothetical protein|nr:DUF6655 family protein [Verrucomicrobiae bacterium]
MEDRRNSRGCTTHFARACAIFIVAALILTGCVSEEITAPSESATEQLLMSTATDQALANANLRMFAGRTVYFDFTYFDSFKSKYAEGTIRDAFSRAGALMATDNKSADVIVEARSGALSDETNSAFFGIPSIPLPIPSTSAIPITPRLAFYSKDSQESYATIALLAYDNKTRAHIYSSGSLDGKAYNNNTTLILFSWWSTDIPQKAKAKDRHKYETWFPQYDTQNMPSPPTKR